MGRKSPKLYRARGPQALVSILTVGGGGAARKSAIQKQIDARMGRMGGTSRFGPVSSGVSFRNGFMQRTVKSPRAR